MSIDSLIAQFGGLVQFKKRTKTGQSTTGRDTYTTSDLGVQISGWLQDLTSAVRSEFGAREIITRTALFTAANPGVSENDFVQIGTETYKITSIENQAGLFRLWQFTVERIEP